MLVLTRKQGSSIVIQIPPSTVAREVRIIVDRISKPVAQHPSARLVFKADDKEVVILREELCEGGKDAAPMG